MTWALRLFMRANEALALRLNHVLSWPAWVPTLTLGSLWGVYIHQTDLVMLILTIQTSVDAAATKTLQTHVRAADEQRESLLREQVDNASTLIANVRAQNDLMLEMMQQAERRDRLAAKRDKAMLTALEARNDLLEFLNDEEVKIYGSSRTQHARKDHTDTNGNRPALRRRNRRKS